MQRDFKKKRGAITAAAVIVFIIALFLGLLVMIAVTSGDRIVFGLYMFYAAVVAAVIIGVIIALNQRLKEIKKGEDEEAKKY